MVKQDSGQRDEYAGFFAEFYDILHAGLHDVDCYLRFASQRDPRPRILEFGSGTGRILLPLAHAGFHMTGVDAAKDMMSICRERLECESEEVQGRVRLIEADIRGLHLGETFDMVIAPCNFLNHFIETGDALGVLRAARDHLAPDGTFILDHSVPDISFMVRANGVERSYDFTHPLTGTKIIDTFTASYDFVRQVETNRIVLEEYSGGKLLRRAETETTLTYYFPRETRVLLGLAGLDILHEQGSLAEDIPIGDRSGEMVFFCGRAQPFAWRTTDKK